MTGTARLTSVVLEAADPVKLAHFYRDLTGMTVTDESDDWVTLEATGGGTQLCVQLAPGHQPPTWPDPASSMQYHLDLEVDDLDAGEELALRLGATKFAHQPGTSFRVFADPAGHPFCLCASD
jgi:catechol-2,3-dioxygenase